MDIGERIKYFRNKEGLSQEKLAWNANINPAFLGELERGKKSPTIKTLEKIADALHISLYEFFAGPGAMSPEEGEALRRITDRLRVLPVDRIQKMDLIIKTILEMNK